jgi:hypothetical protein
MLRHVALICVAAGSVQAFGALMTDDGSECIVRTGRVDNKRDEYFLRLGDCDSDNLVEFRFTEQDSYLESNFKDTCLSVRRNSDDSGARVVLGECRDRDGQLWYYDEGMYS